MLGRILILSLAVLLIVIYIKARRRKEKLGPVGTVKTALVPVLYIALFAYGYIWSPGTFIPPFFSWHPETLLVGAVGLYTLYVVIAETVVVLWSYQKFIGTLTQKEVRIILTQNLGMLAIRESLPVTVFAGVWEEILFRFGLFIAIYPFVTLLLPYLMPTSFFVAFFSWLSLWNIGLITPAIFVSAFLANTVFSLAHLYDVSGSDKLVAGNVVRVVPSWIAGWLYFQMLMCFGLIGAMLAHFLVDFVGMCWAYSIYFYRVKREMHSGDLHMFMFADETINPL